MFRNKNKKRRNRFLNNRGFSLVEVLIAVSILIVIAVPMALNLVTSAQLNSRAKQISAASDLAGSMMEVLQAVDLKDVLTDMNGYAVDENGEPIVYAISGDMLNGYTVEDLREMVFVDDKYFPVTSDNASVQSIVQNGVTSSHFVGNKDNNYAFLISGIETDDMYVDLLATLKLERIYGNINLSDLNEDKTVCIKQLPSLDKDVADEFKRSNDVYVALNADVANVATYSQTAEWYLANMHRTILINIEKIEDEVIRVTMTATYTVESDYLFNNDKTIVKTLGSYVTNSKSEIEEGIYLYYYPLFDSDVSRDNIVIDNEDEVDVSVHLIARSDDPSVDFETIENYHPYVTLKELFEGADLHADVHSNIANDQWSRTRLPSNTYFDIKSMVGAGNAHAFYSVMIQVYQHRESCYDDEGVFEPDEAHLLVQINGSCVFGAHAINGDYDVDSDDDIVETPKVPGLYEVWTDQLIYSWDELIEEGILNEDGVAEPIATEGLVGYLVISDELTSIPAEAYRDWNYLVGVIIPESVTSIGDAAFQGCGGLQWVELGDGVKMIDVGAFAGCVSLTSFDCGNVTTIGDYAFSGCTKLASVTISASVISIGKEAFSPPLAAHIDGADGLWYSTTTGLGYAPDAIPVGKADTYVAVNPAN